MNLQLLCATASGMLFAFGLLLSGMTQPAKVLGFLNLGGLWDAARFGAWDPSLAFVMGGAVSVTLVAFAVTPPSGAANATATATASVTASTTAPVRKPWFAPHFDLPTRRNIDARLLGGAALFGIGWGLVGYCPGPALATLLTGGPDSLIFVAAMVLGMTLAARLTLARREAK